MVNSPLKSVEAVIILTIQLDLTPQSNKHKTKVLTHLSAINTFIPLDQPLALPDYEVLQV